MAPTTPRANTTATTIPTSNPVSMRTNTPTTRPSLPLMTTVMATPPSPTANPKDMPTGTRNTPSEPNMRIMPSRASILRLPRRARRDAASSGEQATTTRVATDAPPYSTVSAADPRPAGSYGASPSCALNDPALAAYPASQLHPYDHHRAALIGLSTALVAAIIIIVSLMANFSTHKDLAPELKQQYETRMATFQQDYQSAQTLAEQRLAQAQQAAALAERNQQLAQANAQAYQVSQQQLRQHQQVNQQLQQQTQAQQAENEQRLYVTQIRMAKQAWDRGDTNQVCSCGPHRSDPRGRSIAPSPGIISGGRPTAAAAIRSVDIPTLCDRSPSRPTAGRSFPSPTTAN